MTPGTAWRLGQADTGAFKALADSVTEDLGGGTGEARKLTEAERERTSPGCGD